MEQSVNRISFIKEYAELEKVAIVNRILKEFSDIKIGPSSFKLNNEMTGIYRKKNLTLKRMILKDR